MEAGLCGVMLCAMKARGHSTKRFKGGRDHAPRKYRATSEAQIEARKFRSSMAWQRKTRAFLIRFPVCFDPLLRHEESKRPEQAVATHHIESVAERFDLRLEDRNLVTLCRECHDSIEQLIRTGNDTVPLFKTCPHDWNE